MVFINRKQRVNAYVAQVIHRKYCSVFELALDTKVHLVGTGRLVVRRIERYSSHRCTGGEGVGHISAVGLRSSLRRRLLELLLQCNDLIDDISDRLGAQRRRVHRRTVWEI